MAEALRLAARGLWSTDPNPRVGCVIVRQGQVVGRGWHEVAGGPHAEIRALAECGSAAQGATVYLTLEPCCHHGRTPPCTNALITAGVARVIAAMPDPNPKVAGMGARQLREAGVAVEFGLMQEQAERLNPGFISRMSRRKPYVRTKIGASLDGRTAMKGGESRWITSEAARDDVQKWRARSSAILTGIGTVLADDPALTVRIQDTVRQPMRVIVDSELRMPPSARLLRERGSTLIACTALNPSRAEELRRAGAEILHLPGSAKVDLAQLMNRLAELEVNELLVEAGARLNGALLEAGLVDELVLYLAPCILGNDARGLADIPGLERLADRVRLEVHDTRAVGNDWRVIAGILEAGRA